MPFKAVISRDNGEPWPPTGMTSRLWLAVEPVTVTINQLIATQPGVLLTALTGPPTTPHGGDLHPHVIRWCGQMYLEDGHHRVTRAALRGCTQIVARVLDVDANHEREKTK